MDRRPHTKIKNQMKPQILVAIAVTLINPVTINLIPITTNNIDSFVNQPKSTQPLQTVSGAIR